MRLRPVQAALALVLALGCSAATYTYLAGKLDRAAAPTVRPSS